MKYILYYPSRIVWGLIVTICFLILLSLATILNFLWNFKFDWVKEIEMTYDTRDDASKYYNRFPEKVYPTVWHWVFKPMKDV